MHNLWQRALEQCFLTTVEQWAPEFIWLLNVVYYIHEAKNDDLKCSVTFKQISLDILTKNNNIVVNQELMQSQSGSLTC